MTQTIQAVRGMNDILPDEAALWERFDDVVRSYARVVERLRAVGFKAPIVDELAAAADELGRR